MNKTWRASYTVEAVVVVSVTVMVLGALILLTFYVHDRAVSQALVCEITAEGSNGATADKRESAVNQAKEQIRESRFLGSRDIESSASANKRKIKASFAANYPVPGFAVQYFSGGSLSIVNSWTYDVIDPAEAIRRIRAGKALVGTVKDLVTGGVE